MSKTYQLSTCGGDITPSFIHPARTILESITNIGVIQADVGVLRTGDLRTVLVRAVCFIVIKRTIFVTITNPVFRKAVGGDSTLVV